MLLRPTPDLLELSQRLWREPVCDARAAGSVGAVGHGGQFAEQALYDVVGRLAGGAVDHAHHSPGPQLRPLRVGAAVGVEDYDDPAPRPACGLEGVVYEELARLVEAASRGGRVAVESPDHVVAVYDQVRGHPTVPAAAWLCKSVTPPPPRRSKTLPPRASGWRPPRHTPRARACAYPVPRSRAPVQQDP